MIFGAFVILMGLAEWCGLEQVKIQKWLDFFEGFEKSNQNDFNSLIICILLRNIIVISS